LHLVHACHQHAAHVHVHFHEAGILGLRPRSRQHNSQNQGRRQPASITSVTSYFAARGHVALKGEGIANRAIYNCSSRARTFPAIMRAIGIADVAAGEGALHTCSILAVSAKRKSCTRVPSRNTAWARMPATPG
jgi:hypothetical protein